MLGMFPTNETFYTVIEGIYTFFFPFLSCLSEFNVKKQYDDKNLYFLDTNIRRLHCR